MKNANLRNKSCNQTCFPLVFVLLISPFLPPKIASVLQDPLEFTSFSLVTGARTAYISQRIASVTHPDILLGSLSRAVQCNHNDAWATEGL